MEITKAVQPIINVYIEKGFSIRDLSHEAQAAIRDCELDYIATIHLKNLREKRKIKNGSKNLYSNRI